MMFKINGVDTVIEFDGDRHYCDSLTIRRDKLKDEVARKANMKVIRFPYWLQLTTETLEYYFGLSTTIVQDFPHGFITTKIFPASFCALGIERFQGELGALPENIIFDVLGSLEDRRIKYGDEFVTTGMKAQIRGAIPVRSAIESWITVEEFIHRSKAVHGEKEYDYTKVKGERLPKIVEHEKKRLHMAMPTAQRGWLYIGSR